MPYKPMKPCSRDGCPNLTHERYCAQHTRDAEFSRRARDYDPAVRKRYGSRWRDFPEARQPRDGAIEGELPFGLLAALHEEGFERAE